MPARTRAVFLGLIALAALIAAFAIYLLTQQKPAPEPITPRFALTDQDGKKVTEADFRGRYMIVFFGFTNCPDVCPLTLQKLSDTLADIPETAKKVTVVLITVDPERDTPEKLKTYVGYFSPDFRALTGTPAEIEGVLKTFKAYARKVPLPESALGYTMDHSSFIYLYGPDGAFVTAFDPGAPEEKLAADLQQNVK